MELQVGNWKELIILLALFCLIAFGVEKCTKISTEKDKLKHEKEMYELQKADSLKKANEPSLSNY